MDESITQEPAASESAAPPAPAAESAPAPAPTPTADAAPESATEGKFGKRAMALLDSMSEDSAKGAPIGPANGKMLRDTPSAKQPEAPAPAASDAPTAEPAKGDAKEGPPTVADAKTEPPKDEESEILETVKSDRGRERIRKVFEDRKRLETDVNDFRAMIKNTGMSPQEFAQTLEFGRLLNSGSEPELRVALELLESQRTAIYKRLGREAPGVDLLSDHADLQKAVEDLEITRDRALEVAKLRGQQAAIQQQQQVRVAQQQQQQQFEQQVNQAAAAMDAYIKTRSMEVDHPARLKIITEHFKNPENLQNFVTTYRPDQWAATIKMMYDNIQVPRTPAPQPIRARPATLGQPTNEGGTFIDRMAARLDAMNI